MQSNGAALFSTLLLPPARIQLTQTLCELPSKKQNYLFQLNNYFGLLKAVQRSVMLLLSR